ncbi:hypothetical protein [Limnohabitans planktonicus]|uniref:Uncharacterized protein n=1 Tax=Limnohabitans planktonicus II-D5 TaxID=1293045 RepID=A0A2T7UE17_9BURK|nr:hypothetical protein [Limnohabitans planktonicus]PVE42858.1 hypothetical protein H663_010140 [Limnohabitans planktonicus II-D5]
MSTLTINFIVCCTAILVFVAVGLFLQSRRNKKRPNLQTFQDELATVKEDGVNYPSPTVTQKGLPSAIFFGTDIQNAAVTVRPIPLEKMNFFDSVPVVNQSLGVASRISALMQAAPSLLVAHSQSGKQLMEVVVNGPLLRAADGNGFRAMTTSGRGINEHARLFETTDLGNLVNATAVWQLASVIVAQKHLADISQKLTELKEAVDAISTFLDEGRRSVIKGTYRYLKQAYEVLTQGELSPAIRGELEACERELLAIQDHLIAECRTQTRAVPKDEDTFGTDSLHKNTVQKYNKLSNIISDLDLCVKTHALNWYVLSLYPGEQSLKVARRKDIEQVLLQFGDLEQAIDKQSQIDLSKFKAFWNSDDTLEGRKNDVSREVKNVQNQLSRTGSSTTSQLTNTKSLLLERDCSTQLIVELFDGQVKQIRQRELVTS